MFKRVERTLTGPMAKVVLLCLLFSVLLIGAKFAGWLP